MNFHFALGWSISLDRFQPFPEISCRINGKPVYHTGLVQDKNGKQIRITAKTLWNKPKKYTKYVKPEQNINKMFEQVVKDFKISDDDKPHLFKLLTDFTIDQLINNEVSDDFEQFLIKYNFKIFYYI